MSYEHILTELKEGIFTITLNRPEVLNAFNWRQQWELNCVLHDALDDKGSRVVVLTGAGRAFSAGLDLKSGIESWGKPLSDRKLIDIPTLLVKHYTKPVIAALNGPAIGWGTTLSLLCDMRYAAESASLSMRFTHVGLVPEAGSPFLLPKIVGLAKALELSYTAKIITAREAAAIGMVNDVFPDDRLMPEVYEVAASIAEKPPLGLELTRRSFYDAFEQTWEEQQQREKLDFGRAAISPEHAQARKKFASKKKS